MNEANTNIFLDMVGSVIAVFVLLSHNELYLTFISTHLHN